MLAWLLLPALQGSVCGAQSGAQTFEAQLVRVTVGEQVPVSNAKLVEPAIAERLGKMPFHWEHFYEVTRSHFSLSRSGTTLVSFSGGYHLEVRTLGASRIEVSFYLKEKLLSNVQQSLYSGEMLILGADAKGKETWLVVLRTFEPKKI